MYFQKVFNIQRQERARVHGELDINVHFEFLAEMFLVDDKVAVYFGGGEVDYRHDGEKDQH